MIKIRIFLICLMITSATYAQQEETSSKERTSIDYPSIDIGVDSLPARKEAQLATADSFHVFHDFQFIDQLPESGITFKNKIVDDAGKSYKLVHYDHGNGIAVADVDGDGLYDIYFVTQLGTCELWKNLGNGKFENITESSGTGLTDRVAVTASFADIDNDGDDDLYVTTVRKGNVLFENDGKGHFKNISKESQLDYVGHSSGAVFFDYNNDGLLDLFLVNVGQYTTDQKGRDGYFIGMDHAFEGHLMANKSERSILFKNLGKNRFVDVSQQVQLMDTSWSGDASFTDFNHDGYPDLYVLNMQGDDHYYENTKGTQFVDKTNTYFPMTPWGTMGIKFFDYNNDGLMDLMLTDMHSDMSQQVGPDKEKLKSDMKWPDQVLQGRENNIFGNAFYKNLDKGKFEEISDKIGVENYWPWGLSVGDLNADGYQDMFITASMNFPFRYGINSLLLNDNGETFRDSEFILGVEPRRDGRTHTFWFDLDCLGADKDHPYCKSLEPGNYSFMGTLGSRSSVIFDLDNDGDLDIVTNDFNSEPQVFISNLSTKKDIHFIKVQLVGKKSNRNGLGATVKVSAGDTVYTQYNDGKSGYLSQSDLPLYFGLGKTAEVNQIEVQWPSGKKSVIQKAITMNSVIRIEESN
jgi:enediyne biosynthesis protein E4